MFLFREVNSRISQVVYMIEGNSSNKILWERNYKVRENGVLEIGSYITIFNPLYILNRLGNKSPIFEYRHLAVIMEPPRMVHGVCDEFGLVKITQEPFFNNACITINSSFTEVIKCSGLLCDQQRVR